MVYEIGKFKDFILSVDPIVLREPLASFLGVFENKSDLIEYSLVDLIKLAGHFCPTVVGAFIVCKRALETLYDDDIPVRGDISITIFGVMDSGVNGVMSQIFSLITGAAYITGFAGIGNYFVRKNLLKFSTDLNINGMNFLFKRNDIDKEVLINLNLSKVPFTKSSELNLLLAKSIKSGFFDVASISNFQDLWIEKIKLILLEYNVDDWLIIKSNF